MTFEASQLIPSSGLAQVSLSGLGVFLITLLFAFLYLRRYKHQYESDILSFTTSVLCLVVVLLTSSLLPVDIFLVSYMKTENGTWADWANSNVTRASIESHVQLAYYILYFVVFLCLFVIIPFVYFYFEEKNDDDLFSTTGTRMCTAFKFTLAFVLFITILFLIGIFVPLREAPDTPANSTEWEKIKYLWDELKRNRGEDAIDMVVSLLSLVGMLNLTVYTSFGMFSWPIGMIRGNKSARDQSEEIQERTLINQTQIEALRTKERNGRLTRTEMNRLEKLERESRLIAREETLVREVRKSLWYKCRLMLRPMEIVIGVLSGSLAFLIWISLLLTNIDKAMYSDGAKSGYSLKTSHLLNPIDFVLVYLQKVFPLDYLLFLLLAWFFVLCTISGIRNLGIRLVFLKMYKLRLRRTRPQALLMTCVTLMLTVLAVNILLFCVSPSYLKYGSQKYVKEGHLNETVTPTIVPCDSSDSAYLDCQMTRNSALLERFFYKAWFFGTVYYWSSWLFLANSFFSFAYASLRKSRSVTDEIVDSDDDDLEELDDDPALSRPLRTV